MTADLTREEIERLYAVFALVEDLEPSEIGPLLAHAYDEPARLSAARAEGVREGINHAIDHARRVAQHHSEECDAGDPARLIADDIGADEFRQAVIDDWPSPAPTEAPTTPTEASAPVDPDEAFHDAVMAIGEAGRIGDLEDEVEDQKARITALEAENRALRERNKKLEDGLRPFAVECNEWVEQIHLLPDETVPEIKAPSDDAVAAARFTLGDLRLARALLQGQGGADASDDGR